MALSCDYRVMSSGSYTIGLNETLLVCMPVCQQFMSVDR